MSAEFHIPSKADNLSLFGRHWAADKPRAILCLIHGFGEHSGRYEPMAKHLNTRGISVMAIDLRGHGKTNSPRGVCKHYSDLSGDVAALLAHARTTYPQLPHYLFGHSMGGALVLDYGLKPNRAELAGYLVSAPLILPKDPVPVPLRLLAKIMRHILPKGSLPNPIPGDKISTLPSEQADYEADGLNHDRLGFGLAFGMLQAGENVLSKAEDWTQPLTLWHAKGDKLTDFNASEQFAQQAQNCQFTSFGEPEHEMHNDVSREAVYTLMINFINSRMAKT